MVERIQGERNENENPADISENDSLYPSCVVIRSSRDTASIHDRDGSHQTKKSEIKKVELPSDPLHFADLRNKGPSGAIDSQPINTSLYEEGVDENSIQFSLHGLLKEQKEDKEVCRVARDATSSNKMTNKNVQVYENQNGVIMRRWRPVDAQLSDTHLEVEQIVLPQIY